MMLIFFIIFLLKLNASTNETNLEFITSYDEHLRPCLCQNRSNCKKNETPINTCENDLVDIKINMESEDSELSNCNIELTNSTFSLLNPDNTSDNQQITKIIFDLWKTFSCNFVISCFVLLTLVIIASYYCYGKNGKIWGLLLTIGFILSMIILGAIITGVEKLKARNQLCY